MTAVMPCARNPHAPAAWLVKTAGMPCAQVPHAARASRQRPHHSFPTPLLLGGTAARAQVVRQAFPAAPLFAIGFSCGGNLVRSHRHASGRQPVPSFSQVSRALARLFCREAGVQQGQPFSWVFALLLLPRLLDQVCNYQAIKGEASPFAAAASLGNGYDLVSGEGRRHGWRKGLGRPTP
jgi:hypothetical protein